MYVRLLQAYIKTEQCLPQSLYQHVLNEFEYQLQLEFDICIESTINYKYPNELMVSGYGDMFFTNFYFLTVKKGRGQLFKL